MLILRSTEASRINQKCITNSSGKLGYIISIYLFSTCVWDGSPRETEAYVSLSPEATERQWEGQPRPACVQTGRTQGLLFSLTSQEHLCPQDTVNRLVCCVGNAHVQAGTLILCRKTGISDNKLISHGLLNVIVRCVVESSDCFSFYHVIFSSVEAVFITDALLGLLSAVYLCFSHC